ncbi:universal stress protein [Nitratireductor sp. L1-7-SE]|uniref:Universal stress protein n=1 Tax=Nitratireductor rhodophyticola TaxID=2854036 RepID=A0ABS7R745_9HYPH|nr:universal stress protein [Nitratireductor rhodophyticola]MBY8916739.1 universal stress protein [Nitratireductor rhodophyticola]MBY8920832.1 universal stress protein [Nitratireductor rhodophyticola]MEC9244472.1 universal stress protein [Pseudomonadota bacterium]
MYKDILVSIDLGHADDEVRTLETAVDYARTFGSRLHVMTVVPDYGMSIVGGFFPKGHEQEAIQHTNEALHDFTKKHVPAEIKHRHIVGHGSIYREILRYADKVKADLIVLSAARPSPEDYLIGPNAARVVRHASISVLVVR